MFAFVILCFGVFGDREGKARRIALSFYEVSDQYNPGNVPFTFPSECQDVCTGASSMQSADVVLANVYKTRVQRSFARQKWVGTFWESPANYNALSSPSDFDYILSYAMDSSFFVNAMVRDTFKLAIETELRTVPYQVRVQNPWMSVWISNCNARARLKLLHNMANKGITYSSYGNCHKSINNAKSMYPTPWDGLEDDIYKHAAQHLFFYAAENSHCRGYVTEKVYHGLVAGSIPIYYGTDDAKSMVPTQSTIFTSDFTEQGLVEHLNKIASNRTLFESYLEWRRHPIEPHMLRLLRPYEDSKCKMCNSIISGKPRHTWTAFC